MKAILFSKGFEAPEELVKFAEDLGYDNPNFTKNFDLMFDNRIVEFCEQNLSNLWDEMVYKGKETYKRKIGFAGAGYIREIDTTRQWHLKYSITGAPIIVYIDVHINTNAYGYVEVIYEEKR